MRDYKETREILEKGAMADGITQTNKIASKIQKEQEREPEGLTQTNEIARGSKRELERAGAGAIQTY